MAENSTLGSTRPDTSSFVEHMRLVHFTLVAASVTIIVPARATEIATLRAIGFGGFPGFVVSLALAAIGGLLGAAATCLIFDGVTASTLDGNCTEVVFDFKLPG